MFRILLALSLSVFLFACEDDDSHNRFCQEPERLNNCIDLGQLSVEEHFQAVVGEWTMVFFISSPESIAPFQSCGEEITTIHSLTFNTDSTYNSFDQDISSSGRWEVRLDTSRLGEITSRVVTDNTLYFGTLEFLCEDELAYIDQRPVDGPYRLFLRN